MLIRQFAIVLFEHLFKEKKYDCEVMKGAEIFIL